MPKFVVTLEFTVEAESQSEAEAMIKDDLPSDFTGYYEARFVETHIKNLGEDDA